MQGLEILINPIKFHSNCISSLGGVVREIFKNKNYQSVITLTKKSLN